MHMRRAGHLVTRRLNCGVMRVNQDRVLWVFGGAAVLVALSSSLLWSGVMSPVVPMPLHQILLAWTTTFGFLVVVPAIYLITLWRLWNSKRFPVAVLVVSLALAAMSALYFVSAWDYGVRYQGLEHTRIVAAENAIGLVVVLSLALVGFRLGAVKAQLAAYFLIFAMLSWCAFPYLGEAP